MLKSKESSVCLFTSYTSRLCSHQICQIVSDFAKAAAVLVDACGILIVCEGQASVNRYISMI